MKRLSKENDTKCRKKERKKEESDDGKFDQCKTWTHHSDFVFKLFGGLESWEGHLFSSLFQQFFPFKFISFDGWASNRNNELVNMPLYSKEKFKVSLIGFCLEIFIS